MTPGDIPTFRALCRNPNPSVQTGSVAWKSGLSKDEALRLMVSLLLTEVERLQKERDGLKAFANKVCDEYSATLPEYLWKLL